MSKHGQERSPGGPGRGPGSRFVAALSVILLAGCGDTEPTWSDGIGDLVHGSCASCHRPGGPAPFSLLTHRDVTRVLEAVELAVSRERMPPWLPAHGPAFAGNRRLPPAAKETLLAWIDAGAPEGDPTAAPVPPEWPSGWTLGEPDLVLRTDEPFMVPAQGSDLFRNFVLPIPVTNRRWVRAVELRPTNPRVVHHATMRVDETRSSRLADAEDSLPGFDEMFSRADAHPPGGFFLGWTPGRVPSPNPDGMAWEMVPGTDFIVQFHLRPTGKEEAAGAEVGFWFTDEAPTRIPHIIRLGSQTLDIPPGEEAYRVEDDFLLPVDVEAVGAYPHAHYLGTSVRSWARLPDGSDVDLMEIPAWDFNWQDAYRYERPISLPAGTRVHLEWTFDNTSANPLNPNRPPQRVVYGPTSGDEMAEFWLQVVPTDPNHLATLMQAVGRKAAADRLEGWQHLVTLDPGDAEAQFGLGTVAQARGDLAEARRRYGLALAAQPDLAQAHHNLGLVEEAEGNREAALRAYRAAVAALPTYAAAMANLGRLLAEEGRTAEAGAVLERAVASDPTLAEAFNNLGAAQRQLGDPQAALATLRQAVELDPERAGTWFNLAFVQAETGRGEEAMETLNRGLALDGDNVGAVITLAWILVAHPEAEVRRPEMGGALAQEVYRRTGPHPVTSDLLGAAYAATGRFDAAERLAGEALDEAGSDPAQAARLPGIRSRLREYGEGRPYRGPPP